MSKATPKKEPSLMDIKKERGADSENNLYLTDRQVAARYSVGRATPWRWVKDSNFPPPVKLGAGCTRWKLADLKKWESDREEIYDNPLDY